jgi:antitoxin component YwqK of YwqJK toxin-antitoxin module
MKPDAGQQPENARDPKGHKTGLWREADARKGDFIGSYHNGRREGLWRHHFRDGTVRSESNYRFGILHGVSVWYRENGGLLQKGTFVDGEKTGLWERWSPEGNLIDRGHREDGKKTGEWQYFAADGSVERTTVHRPHSA